MTTTTITKFNEAYQALIVAKTVDEVKQIRDKMEALRAYLKQQGQSLEMQNTCAEIKLRAERRAGELLKDMPKNGGTKGQLNGKSSSGTPTMVVPESTPKLSELGISWNESSRFQSIATLPDEIFEQEIAEQKNNCDELTSSRMLKLARRFIARNDKVEPPPMAGKYRVIYADPPWKYNDSGLDDYGHAERHYPPMSITELCELGPKVKDISETDAVLFFWVTSPMLEDSFKVINAWGFKYKSSFVWDKVKHNYGHYNSVRHELLLICTKGSCTPDINELIDSVQSIERSNEHSEKPEEFRAIIDKLYTHGSRIELFARRSANPDWEVWGNEPA